MLQWVKFWFLGLIWGSSFMLIKVSVEDLGPFVLVSIRLSLAAALFFMFLHLTGRRLPTDPKLLLPLTFVGVFNTAVPFVLISTGETMIDSSVATVFNATVPLFNLVIAHFVLADERLNTAKIVGLIVGFMGVVLLVSRGLSTTDNPVLGQILVMLGALCYAVSLVVIRSRLRSVDRYTIAGWSLVIGAIAIVSATLLVARPFPPVEDVSRNAILAAITLAVVNTAGAYFLFYELLENWGVRASLITYALPPIGVTLGVLVLDEPLTWQLVAGGVLIMAGIITTKADTPRYITNLLPIHLRPRPRIR
ncbi:MAG: DMT family transporter [Chloroflexi bacterium]|nr:DMT family transporter [Chloroflexota bacterium]